jgi:hypothetical protein
MSVFQSRKFGDEVVSWGGGGCLDSNKVADDLADRDLR